MKYIIAKITDSEYYDEPHLEAISLINPIRDLVYRKVRIRLYEQVNKINHPYICKLLNRHIMPEPTGPWGLDVFGPRKCLRCGEVRSPNLLISGVEEWKGLNAEAESFLQLAPLRLYSEDNETVI